MGKLTKRTVDAIHAAPGDSKDGKFQWDSELRGFGCRVYASGRRVYFVQYRLPGGRQRRLRLGNHGALTPEKARKRAQDVLTAVAHGEDPAAEKQRLRDALSFRQLAESYISDLAKRGGRPSTLAEWRRLLDRHILPVLGPHKIESIDSAEVERLHRKLETTPTTANRVLTVVSTVLNYAERKRLLPLGSNPCRLVERFVEDGRGRALTGKELERLGAALDAAEEASSEHPSAILAIRLALLTGMRRTELLGAPFKARRTEWAGLRWEYVDLENRMIRLPRDKAGSDGRIVPLSSAACELLAQAQRRDGNPYVCWGENGKPFVGIDKPRRRLFAAAGIDAANFHSLRHTHGTTGGNLGLNSYLVAKLLGHRDERTSARYVHVADDPTREAAERVADAIASRLERRTPGRVIELRERDSGTREGIQ